MKRLPLNILKKGKTLLKDSELHEGEFHNKDSKFIKLSKFDKILQLWKITLQLNFE